MVIWSRPSRTCLSKNINKVIIIKNFNPFYPLAYCLFIMNTFSTTCLLIVAQSLKDITYLLFGHMILFFTMDSFVLTQEYILLIHQLPANVKRIYMSVHVSCIAHLLKST